MSVIDAMAKTDIDQHEPELTVAASDFADRLEAVMVPSLLTVHVDDPASPFVLRTTQWELAESYVAVNSAISILGKHGTK